MTHVLRSWTMNGLIFQKQTCFKSIKYFNIFKFHSHLKYMRFHIQPQVQMSSYNTKKMMKTLLLEHRKYLDILKLSMNERKTNERYVTPEVVEKLCLTFDMKKSKCKSIIYQKELENYSTSHIIDKADFLKELGVHKEHLLRAPWLLWESKEATSSKLALLRKPFLFKQELDGLGFTIFHAPLIENYRAKFQNEHSTFPNYHNRIYYIADKLNLPIDLLTLKLIYAWQVLHVKKEKLDAVIEVLLENKIEPMNIVNDVWVFLHNVELMNVRLTRMKEAFPSHPVKLWVCRCTDYYFERAFQRHKRNISKKSLEAVLRDELALNEEDLRHILGKTNIIHKLRPSNIEFKLRFLKENGIDINMIKKHMTLLSYSEKRVVERAKILRGKNIKIVPNILSISQEKFQAYVSKFVNR